MMGFFVILLAMNLKPASGGQGDPNAPGKGEPNTEVLDMAIAIREAFHNPVKMDSLNPNDMELVRRLRQRADQTDARDRSLPGEEHDVKSIRPSDYYGLGGVLQFDDQSAELTELTKRSIQQLATQLRGRRAVIEVRGHTSTAEAFSQADRGMKLSYERALAVAQALAADGVAWGQMQLIASADNDRATPIVYDKAGQRSNQRVEIVATDRPLPDYVQIEAVNSKP